MVQVSLTVVRYNFFAQSVRIKPALPQAALLSIFMYENQYCSISLRDLY